jgi:hypothetical protein
VRDLLIITPTRGRPDSARRLAEAVRATATAETDLLFAVDEDDPSYAEMDGLLVIRGPRATCGQWTNKLAAEHGSRYRALASLGDDHVPETEGWDAQLLGAIDDIGGTGIAYGNDTAQGQNLPTAPVISSDIVAALGWMFLPAMIHYYCDNAWKDIAGGAGCLRYVPDVVIRHLHPNYGTAPRDATYAEADPAMTADSQAYQRYCADPGGLAADIAKIRKLHSAGRKVKLCGSSTSSVTASTPGSCSACW